MTVKIVTDSVSDLSAQVAIELGIAVVPLSVRFGVEVYRDGIDLSSEQFYERLKRGKTMPVTSVPAPVTFAETYDRLCDETDEILVITVSSKLSGTYAVASQSVGLMKRKCRVEVIDSRVAAMAEGLVVITAAKTAKAGASFEEVKTLVQRNLPRADLRGAFDTLEYLQRGGRIGKAQALLGSILNVNPVVGLKDGEVVPIARERSRSRAIDNLCNFALAYRRIEELAVEYATTVDDAEAIIDRLSFRVSKDHIYRSRATPVIGTHTGPGLLVVSVLGDR